MGWGQQIWVESRTIAAPLMKTRHFLQLILLSALWGASFPLLRIVGPALGPWLVAGLRCLLAAGVLGVLMYRLKGRWPPRQAWRGLALLSLVTLVIPFLLYTWAALIIPAGYSAVLNATAPLFGVLGAAAVREERLTGRRLLGCAIGFAGVALLVQLGPVEVTRDVMLAALACVIAASCYGVGAIFMRRATLTHDALPSSAVMQVTGALMLLIPASLAVPAARPTAGVLMAIGMLGIVTSGLMYWISMRLMREIPASAATSSAFMIPLFGVTWGALFLNETVTFAMIPGCLLVLMATALITEFNPFKSRAVLEI